MSGFSEHKVLLCLDRDLRTAFIKLQADRDLGRSYAGLLAFVEGLYRLGYITKEVYEVHFKKYNELKPVEKPKPLTHEELKIEGANRTIEGMIEQFTEHKENASWLKSTEAYAERFPKLESATRLLSMIKAVTVQ